MASLQDRSIVLGVTGSIAIYRACDLVRALRREGASVRVVMTSSATRLLAPQVFRSLTGQPVRTELFGPDQDYEHLPVQTEADILLVAPATANFLGKAANGIADDLLTTLFMATPSDRVIIAPAMNYRMYEHPATVANIRTLRKRGALVMDCACGDLACGESGRGRFPPVIDILAAIQFHLSPHDLNGWRFLVTAGPTREPLDPVRYLSNRSSGSMGYALAQEAHRRGAQVTLISGPVDLQAPFGVETIRVETAQEMHKAALRCAKTADVIISAAAVSDFRPLRTAIDKIKKNGDSHPLLPLTLTPDILTDLSTQRRPDQTLVGFALETEALLDHARQKLKTKKLDLIVANSAEAIGNNVSQITLLTRTSDTISRPMQDKATSARDILDQVLRIRKTRRPAAAGK